MAVDLTKALLLAENFSDSGTVTCADANASYPTLRLQKKLIGKKFRTNTVLAANTKLVIDLGSAKNVDAVLLVRHNLTSAATWQIILSTHSDLSSPVKDTGAISAGAVDGWPRNDALWIADATYSARYIGINIDDHTNAAGYLEISRLFIGPGLQSDYQFDYGSTEGVVDGTQTDTTPGGVAHHFYVPPQRTGKFQLSAESQASMNALIQKVDFGCGRSGDVYVVPDPATPSSWYIRNVWGPILPETWSMPSFDFRTRTLTNEERL
jgi:hypothetical protein